MFGIRPTPQHLSLRLHVAADNIRHDSPMRVAETRFKPPDITLLVERSAARESCEGPVIPHYRLTITQTPLRVLRVGERHAEVLSCHLVEFALRSERRPVVVNHNCFNVLMNSASSAILLSTRAMRRYSNQ
jgi:hypothetical protein